MFETVIGPARRLPATLRQLAGDRRAIESLEWAVIAAVVISIAVGAYSELTYTGIDGFFNGLGTGIGSVRVVL